VVSRKVATAPRLPKKEALADTGRSAISSATAISIAPIKFETCCRLRREYIHDRNGL